MTTPITPSSAPAVAVVTVSYGSETVLAGFLASVPPASVSPVLVTVADNKPTAGTAVQELTEKAHGVYLPLDRNLGYGGGMNAAARTIPASTEWILVSNPDVVLGPGAIDAMVAAGSTDARIGSVGPAIYGEDGELYPSARSVPSLRTGVGHALFANLWLGNPWSRAYRKDTDASPVRRDAGWLSGACLLVRKSAFDSLGGFDDGFFMYFEDVDLGFRLGKAGFRNVYEPAASVTHSGAHSTTSNSKNMIEVHHQSARRFLNKKYSGAVLWPVRLVLTIGLRVRSTLVQRSLDR